MLTLIHWESFTIRTDNRILKPFHNYPSNHPLNKENHNNHAQYLYNLTIIPLPADIHYRGRNILAVPPRFKGQDHCLSTPQWLHLLEHRNLVVSLGTRSKLSKEIKGLQIPAMVPRLDIQVLDTDSNSLGTQHLPLVQDRVQYPQLLATKVRIIEEGLLKGNNMDQLVVESKGEAHRHQLQESGIWTMPIRSYVS